MRLEGLSATTQATVVAASRGDVVRLEQESGHTWFYCRVDDRLPNGDLVCSVIDAQSWPDLMVEGIVPGAAYVVAPPNVLSVVAKAQPRRETSSRSRSM
jgi:hypothetical protein